MADDPVHIEASTEVVAEVEDMITLRTEVLVAVTINEHTVLFIVEVED